MFVRIYDLTTLSKCLRNCIVFLPPSTQKKTTVRLQEKDLQYRRLADSKSDVEKHLEEESARARWVGDWGGNPILHPIVAISFG